MENSTGVSDFTFCSDSEKAGRKQKIPAQRFYGWRCTDAAKRAAPAVPNVKQRTDESQLPQASGIFQAHSGPQRTAAACLYCRQKSLLSEPVRFPGFLSSLLSPYSPHGIRL